MYRLSIFFFITFIACSSTREIAQKPIEESREEKVTIPTPAEAKVRVSFNQLLDHIENLQRQCGASEQYLELSRRSRWIADERRDMRGRVLEVAIAADIKKIPWEFRPFKNREEIVLYRSEEGDGYTFVIWPEHHFAVERRSRIVEAADGRKTQIVMCFELSEEKELLPVSMSAKQAETFHRIQSFRRHIEYVVNDLVRN